MAPAALLLMELELVEPELFFRLAPDAASAPRRRRRDADPGRGTATAPPVPWPSRSFGCGVRSGDDSVTRTMPSSHQSWFIWWRPGERQTDALAAVEEGVASRAPLTYGCSTMRPQRPGEPQVVHLLAEDAG